MAVQPIKSDYNGIQAKPLPPKTQGPPLLGALPAFLRRPFNYLMEARARYGDIYMLDLGIFKWVVLNNPRHADYILRENDQNYRKGGAMWDSVRTLLGNGLVVSEGDFWLRQRRMMQPHFHRQRVAGLANAMVMATLESIDSWEQAARSQQPLKLLPELSAITMRVIVRALFGQGLSSQDIDKISELAAFVMDYMLVGMLTSKLPKWLPLPGSRRYRQAIRELDTIITRIIAEERQAATHSDSLLAMLVEMVDADTGERMTDTQLRDEVMTFFIAGYETTSLALTWTLHFLSQHPEILHKVQAEIDSVLGDRQPNVADLGGLTYTRMVLQESMRLRPPSWWVPRVAIADDEIDGYTIPAGTTVVSLTYSIHHNPQVWIDPEQFNPERFTPEQIAQRHKLAWVPFGSGQRQCIGRDFAIMEAQIILAMLLQRFSISPTTSQIVEPQLSSTLKPKGELFIKLAQRSH